MPNDPPMTRIEVYTRTGTFLGEVDQPGAGPRFAYDGQGLFELPISHHKATPAILKKHNQVVIWHSWLPNDPWGGYIANTSWSPERVTVTCNPYKMMLSRRRSDITILEEVPADEAFVEIINHANRREHTGIHVGSVVRGTKLVTLELHRDNLYDKMTELMEQANLDWRLTYVSPNHYIADMRETSGTDKTGQVFIIAGFDTEQLPDYNEETTGHIANSITGVGQVPEDEFIPEGEDEYEYRPYATVDHEESKREFGLAEDTIDYEGVEDEVELGQLVQVDLEDHAFPKILTDVVLNNSRDLWSRIGDYDIVALQIPEYHQTGIVVPISIKGREVDSETGLMAMVVEVVQGAKARTLDMYKYMRYPEGTGPFHDIADRYPDGA